MDGDDVAMLDAQVVSNHPVHTGTTVIKIVIGQDDEHSVPPLLALYKHSIPSKQLKGFHGVVGQRDDRVVIVDRVSDTMVRSVHKT